MVHQEKQFLLWMSLDVFGMLCEGLAIDKMIKICFKAYLRKVGDDIMLIFPYQMLLINLI